MSKTINNFLKIKIDNNTLAKQATSLYDFVKEKKWSYYYDDQLDQLYITPKKGVSMGFDLVTVDSELSVYVNDKSQLGGVMIPYFRANLSTHDEIFKPYKNIFTKSIDGGKTAPKKEDEKIKSLTNSIIVQLEKSLLSAA